MMSEKSEEPEEKRPSPSKYDDYEPTPEQYWEMLDGKIQQEVSWIQQRVGWLATFQGLLFATFGLIYQTTSDGGAARAADRLILIAIAVVGLLTCLTIMAGLWAASNVLAKIATEWTRLVPNEKVRVRFPDLRTGKRTRMVGMLSSWGPAVLFIFTWLAIIIFVLFI